MNIRTAGNNIHHAGNQSVGLIRNVLHAPASINQILSIIFFNLPTNKIFCSVINFIPVRLVDPNIEVVSTTIDTRASTPLVICPGLGSISASLLNLWHSKRSNYKTTIFLIKLQEWLRMYISFKHNLWTIISNPDYLQKHWGSWNSFTSPWTKKFTKLDTSDGHILYTRIERTILNSIVNGHMSELK